MKRVCANVEARRRSLVLFWFILGHLSSIDDCRARGTVVSQHEVIPRFRLCFPFYVKVTVEPPCGREGLPASQLGSIARVFDCKRSAQ